LRQFCTEIQDKILERLLHEDIDIVNVNNIVRDLMMKSRFSRKRAEEWDKLLDMADKVEDQTVEKFISIRRTTEVAQIQVRTASATAKAENGSKRCHKLALGIRGSRSCEYLAAGVAYSDLRKEYENWYRTQAAAFAAAAMAEQRLVHCAMCKRVLTAVVTVAKQGQQ